MRKNNVTATTDRAPILKARNLKVVFPTGSAQQTAVEDFSLDVYEQEIAGIIGETGCGKSTAVHALMGLVRAPGRIVAGQVFFQGKKLLDAPERELRAIRGRDISMIVQNPHGALNPLLPVGQQIANVYRAHHPVSHRRAIDHALAMLTLVGINDPERRLWAFPHELSGGMAQRVLIALALSSKPKLIIADEPTSGLDVTIQAQILDQMWQSVQATGSAILFVTQDLGIIANYCDRVIVMVAGRIVEQAPVADFFAAPQHDYSKSILRLYRQLR